MKKSKSGISLIVLVITIIVLAILAATVIITITNSGLINASKDSVKEYEVAELRSLAVVAWEEALLDKNIITSEQYTNYVKTYLRSAGYTDEKLAKYNIIADNTGVTVTITNSEITLTLDKTQIAKKVGETETLTAQLINGSGELVWTTSDENVVKVQTVQNVATLTFIGEGNATITVTYVDGISATCEVTVSGKDEVELITFTIDGNEYQAEKGMTFEKWFGSKYDVDGQRRPGGL